MGILGIVKIFIRFCWLAIHPIRKSEEVVGVLGLIVTFLIVFGLVGAGVVGWFAPSPLPEPSPRWPLIVAYPTILLAILLLIAGLRLQYRLSALDELANIKEGDVVRGKDINVSLLFQKLQNIFLANVTFKNCKLRGPCVVVVKGNIELDGCGFRGGAHLEESLIEAQNNRKYSGVGAFVHCKFQYCTFENIAWLIPNELRDKMLRQIVHI